MSNTVPFKDRELAMIHFKAIDKMTKLMGRALEEDDGVTFIEAQSGLVALTNIDAPFEGTFLDLRKPLQALALCVVDVHAGAEFAFKQMFEEAIGSEETVTWKMRQIINEFLNAVIDQQVKKGAFDGR